MVVEGKCTMTNRLNHQLVGWTLCAIAATANPAFAQVNPDNGHHYFRVDTWRTYAETQQIAALVGGYPIRIDDAQEAAWALAEFGTFHWLDLSDSENEGTFLWGDSTAPTFTSWELGQPSSASPDDDQVYVGTDGWRTAPPNTARFPVIESTVPLLPSISGIVCEPSTVSSTFTIGWNPGPYDEIRIYRNYTLEAVIPGTETTWTPGPIGLGGFDANRFAIVGVASGQLTRPGFCFEYEPDPAFALALRFDQAIGESGDTVDLSIMLDHTSPDPVTSYSCGVCPRPGDAVAVNSVVEGTITDIVGPSDFFQSFTISEGTAVSAVFSFLALDALPAGLDYQLAVIDYTILDPSPGEVPIEFCDEVGSPPVVTVVVADGMSHWTARESSLLTIASLQLLRGDCNTDDAVNLADVLFLGTRLFDPTIGDYPCREACEANGDAQINIADMIYLLNYLFVSGPTPPPPFPDCGTDPEPSTTWGCLVPNCP